VKNAGKKKKISAWKKTGKNERKGRKHLEEEYICKNEGVKIDI
jgi:hypothetical protein